MPAPTNVFQPNSTRLRDGLQRVFVYGTLKRGFGNHFHYLQRANFLGNATIEGIMFHLGGYPAINLSEKFSTIYGEVYTCTWEEVLDMDVLEGVNRGYYTRMQMDIPPYGITWLYMMDRDKCSGWDSVIPSGNWQGVNTPEIPWGGWGKGALIGPFSTSAAKDEIQVGGGNSHVLRRIPGGKYELVNIQSQVKLGEYSRVSEILKGSPIKPPLSLVQNPGIHQDRSYKDDGPTYDPPPKQLSLPAPVSTVSEVTDAMAVKVVEIPKIPIQRKYDDIMSERLGIKVSEA